MVAAAPRICAVLGTCAGLAFLAGCTPAPPKVAEATPPPAPTSQISFSEKDALVRQIYNCWTLPVGVEGTEDMVVQLHIQVRPDRTVQSITIEDQSRLGRDPTFRAVAESARQAVARCSPLVLPPGKYALWRDITLNFRPGDAING